MPNVGPGSGGQSPEDHVVRPRRSVIGRGQQAKTPRVGRYAGKAATAPPTRSTPANELSASQVGRARTSAGGPSSRIRPARIVSASRTSPIQTRVRVRRSALTTIRSEERRVGKEGRHRRLEDNER